MNSPEKDESRKKLIGRVRLFFSVAFFPLLIFYYEIVLHKLTVANLDLASLVYILLFSVSIGLICYLLRSLISVVIRFVSYMRSGRPLRKNFMLITEVMILILMLPYLVEMFVYSKFNIFYDINTITGGAGGVMTGFMGDTIRMVFAPSGLWRLFLLFLPLFIYPRILGRFDRKQCMNFKKMGKLLITCLIVFFLARILILLNPVYKDTYSKEYNYGEAVSAYGLLTGIRLDLKNNSKNAAEFEAENPENPGNLELPADTPVEYNVLDIDFNALADSTDDETLKALDSYVAGLTPSCKNEYTGLFEGKNLIFITAEAFSGDIINEELTPTLYRLATKGINFTDYYQPASAGTTGGEYENLFGMLPMDGGKSMKDTKDFSNYFTMGNQLNRLGYTGYAFHNNSYTFYDRNETHVNLGYSEGFMGYGNGMEAYVEKSWPESDLEMMEGTLDLYIDREPFNIYYMTVSGHSDYSKSANDMAQKNWSRVMDLNCSDTIKAYYACNLELEDALTYLVEKLEEKKIADDTVIVLSADHFPYGLDDDASLGNMPYLSELYGHEVNDYLDRDHNTLIIWSGCLEDREEPIVVDTPVSSLDILPTLSNLFGTEFDSRLFVGRDVFSDAPVLMFDGNYNWKTDKGYFIAKQGFTAYADATVEEGYESNIKKIVRNKMNYCKSLLSVDYFAHVMSGVKDTSESSAQESTEQKNE